MSNSIILVGGGGNCKNVIDILKDNNNYNEILISDLKENLGKEILGIRIEYTDDQLEELYKKGFRNAFVSMGKVKIDDHRKKLFDKIKNIGFNIPIIISNSANVSKYSEIGEGTLVGRNTTIKACSKIGKNCIINAGSIIGHDCVIEDNVHIAPGAILLGGTYIGNNSFVGAGAVIIQNINISEDTLIGAGAVVVKDILEPGVYVGNPARKIK